MSICSWEKQYKTAQERQVTMEKLLIDITNIKLENGLAICIPQVGEIANIYNQAEHELRAARLQAADELERLYKIEKGLKDLVAKIEKHNNGA